MDDDTTDIARSGIRICRDRPEESARFFERAEAMTASRYGQGSGELAEVLLFCGIHLFRAGHHELAHARFVRAHDFARKVHGIEAWEYRITLQWLAGVAEERGQFGESERLLVESTHALGEFVELEMDAEWFYALARFYEKRERYSEALAIVDRILPAAEKMIAGDCSFLDYFALKARLHLALGQRDDWVMMVNRIK